MATNTTEMVVDLRAGETVICPSCKNGRMLPMYTDDPAKAVLFQCEYCKEKLILNLKMPRE